MSGQSIGGDVEKLARAARALNAAYGGSALAPPMWFLTDESRTPDPVSSIAKLPDDCGVVFRHYDAPRRTALARDAVAACHAAARRILIAGDIALARALGADGVHCRGAMAGNAPHLRAGWPDGMISVAAHNADELERARHADIAFLSPVFPTQSHPGADHLGVAAFAALVQQARLPVYALGGVTADNVHELDGTGCAGIAAIGAFIS